MWSMQICLRYWQTIMHMIRDEGRVYGARYLTVHPVISWNHTSTDWGNIETWGAMMAWMIEMFGPTAADGVHTPGQRWYANNAKFWFRNEEDLLLFLLRWSRDTQ